MEESSVVRLELSSKPESISLVRGMLAGVAEPLELDLELVDDLKTAVSEACNNVALHAYEHGPGPLLVNLGVHGETVGVVVRDWGDGINHVAPSSDRMHVGLALISALADRVEFLSAADGGTEVRMLFDRAGDRAELPEGFPEIETGNGWRERLSGDVVVTLAPVKLLSGVLGRLARALAASARFTLDRFSDLYLVTDALAAHAQNAANSSLISFALHAGQRRLEMTVGPFNRGIADQVRDPSGTEQPLLTLLADELTTESANSSELLTLVMQDRIGAEAMN